MYKDIETIYQKYGDLVFSLAIPTLLQRGTLTCGSGDYKEAALQKAASSPKGANDPAPLISPELETEVALCCTELATLKLSTLLKYIKTDFHIKDVKVYPGKIYSFKERVSGKSMLKVCIRTPLSAGERDRLRDHIRNRIVGSRGLDIHEAICSAMTELGIKWDFVGVDHEITI